MKVILISKRILILFEKLLRTLLDKDTFSPAHFTLKKSSVQYIVIDGIHIKEIYNAHSSLILQTLSVLELACHSF